MRLEGTLNSCKTTAKTHSTMKQKRFLPLYAEYLHFLTKNATGLRQESTHTTLLNKVSSRNTL